MKSMKSAKALLGVGIVTAGLLISFGYVSVKNDFSAIAHKSSSKKVERKEFDVSITSIDTKEIVGIAKANEATFDGTEAKFDTELINDGDAVVYSINIKNNGTKAVNLENVNITEQEDGSGYVFYTVGNPKEVLQPGETYTLDVVASYDASYVGDITTFGKKASVKALYSLD